MGSTLSHYISLCLYRASSHRIVEANTEKVGVIIAEDSDDKEARSEEADLWNKQQRADFETTIRKNQQQRDTEWNNTENEITIPALLILQAITLW